MPFSEGAAATEQGHSLIELMVVLVLVSLVTALAAPALASPAATSASVLSGVRREAMLAGRDSIVLLEVEGASSPAIVRVRPDGSQVRPADLRFPAVATEPLP